MKKYVFRGETFYLQKAPNGYLVVTHESDLVGYVGVRQDGTEGQPYGWVTPIEVLTERHTHRGLADSNVADPPTEEGQLLALCRHYLEHLEADREAQQGQQQFNHVRHDAQGRLDEFFDSQEDGQP